MKRIISLGFLLLFLLLVAACAAKGPFTEERRGNVVTYARPETGNAVTVTLSDRLKYDKRVRRDFMGANIEGHLYRAEDHTSVLVSNMVRKEFENLIGQELETTAVGIKAYPPHTSWLPGLCRLVRAYVVSVDCGVVVAVKFGPLYEGECDGTISEEAYMADHLDEVAEFDRRAEEDISISW